MRVEGMQHLSASLGIQSRNISCGPWHAPGDSNHLSSQPKALSMHTGQQMHENHQ